MNKTLHAHRGPQSDPAAVRKGASAVEMAVIAPILFGALLAIFEFGRAFMVGQLVTDAAREGARLAAIGTSNTELTGRIEQILIDSVGITAADVTVTLTVDNQAAGNEAANAESGDACTVLVQIPFNKVQFIPGNYLSSHSINAQVTMRRE